MQSETNGLGWQEIDKGQITSSRIAGIKVFIARTGFKGEPITFELFVSADNATTLWKALLKEEERKGRNQIAILGDVLIWQIYEQVLKEKKTLKQDNPRSAFLYHLLRYARMWRLFKEENDKNSLLLYPLLAYDITRNVDEYRQPNLKAWARRLVKIPLGENREERIYLEFMSTCI